MLGVISARCVGFRFNGVRRYCLPLRMGFMSVPEGERRRRRFGFLISILGALTGPSGIKV